jgi:hypothetical protein
MDQSCEAKKKPKTFREFIRSSYFLRPFPGIVIGGVAGYLKHIRFADMEFDNPESHVIRNAQECSGFMGLPFTVYYKNGKLVKATTSIQNEQQINTILDAEFGKP